MANRAQPVTGEGTCNPYESSRLAEPKVHAESCSTAAQFWQWRVYLLFHLGTVILMVVLQRLADSPWGAGSWQAELMQATGAVGLFLIVHNTVSPIFIVVLFAKAYGNRRYALAGLVELLLTAAGFFVCLPLVQ